MKTLTVFGNELPIIADLGDGWFLVEHPNGPAISTDKFDLLCHPAYRDEDVPAVVRFKAVEALITAYTAMRKAGAPLPPIAPIP